MQEMLDFLDFRFDRRSHFDYCRLNVGFDLALNRVNNLGHFRLDCAYNLGLFGSQFNQQMLCRLNCAVHSMNIRNGLFALLEKRSQLLLYRLNRTHGIAPCVVLRFYYCELFLPGVAIPLIPLLKLFAFLAGGGSGGFPPSTASPLLPVEFTVML